MAELRLYNTLSRQKEVFKPLKKKEVGFYHCGPTVYWVQHIGNMRAVFCGDIVRRTLEYFGYKVKHIRNYTDVGHLTGDNLGDADLGEDRMEKGVRREGLSPQEIARKYIKIYEKDAEALNTLMPSKKPKATECIKEMMAMVKVLLEKGYAYTTDLAIYFDISKAKDYTRLSGQKLENLIENAGKGEISDSQKRNPLDFSLWFFRAGTHKNALQYWPSPFKSPLVKKGEGFPGWHIECSAMAKKFLGKTIDIHMGGVEHISIHHANEIAQSESANGAQFANYWLHNEHLTVNGGKKMSKSEGTGYTLSEIKEREFNPLALRYLFLQAHYRSKQDFSWEAMAAAQKGLDNLYEEVRNLGKTKGKIDKEFKDKFSQRIGDDFNTPQALATIWEVLKSDLSQKDKLATILDFDKVLGLNLAEIEAVAVPKEIRKLAKEREKARQEKNWQRSDEIRHEIEKLGYRVEDDKTGSRISPR